MQLTIWYNIDPLCRVSPGQHLNHSMFSDLKPCLDCSAHLRFLSVIFAILGQVGRQNGAIKQRRLKKWLQASEWSGQGNPMNSGKGVKIWYTSQRIPKDHFK